MFDKTINTTDSVIYWRS